MEIQASDSVYIQYKRSEMPNEVNDNEIDWIYEIIDTCSC